jgi:hypothetical protein
VSLFETTELGEQVTEQVVRHGVGRIEHERLSQHPFGFDVAIFGQERPCRAEASESRLRSRRCRAAKTADRLVAVAQCVDQCASAEPGLRQRRQ